MKKLAVITSHPIQYNAPLFKALAESNTIVLQVFYTWGQSVEMVFDPGFGETRKWDIALLQGYPYKFMENVSKNPGSHHFAGIDNPSLIKEIEFFEADAILVYGWSFKSHLKVLRYFKGRKTILFRGDSTLLDEAKGYSLRKLFRRVSLKWVYSHIDFALYVGLKNKEYFLAHGLKPAQLVYAPHAIDNDRFAEPDATYQQVAVSLKNSVGIKMEDLVLLFAGKLEKKKDPLFLIRLLEKIPDKRLKVLYVGSGHLLGTIQTAARADDRVIVMGFKNQQEMPAVYRMADLFILPSSGPGETWGLP
ncbi:MAG: glycosyltransferase family 4 protein [Ferruginibacter sp.]